MEFQNSDFSKALNNSLKIKSKHCLNLVPGFFMFFIKVGYSFEVIFKAVISGVSSLFGVYVVEIL